MNQPDYKNYNLTLKILEKLASYEDQLKQIEGGVESNDAQESKKVLAEFYVIRTVHVCFSPTSVHITSDSLLGMANRAATDCRSHVSESYIIKQIP